MLKKIRSSIFLKVFFSIIAILMIVNLLIYGIVSITTPQNYQKLGSQQFSIKVEALIKTLESVSRKDAENIILDFCIENQVAIALKGKNDSIVYGDLKAFQKQDKDTGVYQKKENIQYSVEVTDKKNTHTEAEDVDLSSSVKVNIKFKDKDGIYALSITRDSKKNVNEILQTFLMQSPMIIGISFLISMVGSFLCSRILVKPVMEISRISKRMTGLDMTWHCDVNRSDELGILANNLNTMAQKLNMALYELENTNQQLQQELEKEKIQEKQRHAFFSAVSHELKTPITILKGQIENMMYEIGDYKNTRKHLPRAFHTVERLESLVKEILTVSKLSIKSLHLSKKAIEVDGMVQECLDTYESIALKKEITITYHQLDYIAIIVDKKLFQMVLSNLISNAISYSPKGADVFVKVTKDVIIIENTGIHIPQDRMLDLFAPLTRVEESRSKETGGTGLGLYIVKMILDVHNLTYDIKNTKQGVCFTIYLRQNQK